MVYVDWPKSYLTATFLQWKTVRFKLKAVRSKPRTSLVQVDRKLQEMRWWKVFTPSKPVVAALWLGALIGVVWLAKPGPRTRLSKAEKRVRESVKGYVLCCCVVSGSDLPY